MVDLQMIVRQARLRVVLLHGRVPQRVLRVSFNYDTCFFNALDASLRGPQSP